MGTCPACGVQWRSFDGDQCASCGWDAFDAAVVAELRARDLEDPGWWREGISLEEFLKLADDESAPGGMRLVVGA